MNETGDIFQGGEGDVVPIQRLEDVEKGLAHLSNELLLISAENAKFQNQIQVLKTTTDRHEKEVKEIKDLTSELRMQYKDIKEKLDGLDTRIFLLLQQSTTENHSVSKSIFELLKYVIGGTIIVMVASQFVGAK